MSRSNKRGLTRRRFLMGGAGSLGTVFLGDTFWYEPQAIQVKKLDLSTNRSGQPVRMVQISDLHLNQLSDFHAKVATRIAELRPDLILLTGDYLEEKRNIRGVLDFLKKLAAPHGIYAVQGNWEYWSRLEGENLRRHFSGVGVQLLINERADINVSGQALSILGLDYPSSSNQLKLLMQTVDPERSNVILSHVPAFAHEALSPHIDLILCGHTHGGQVRLPMLPPLYLPLYTGRFVAGYYEVSSHKIPLYVNRGLGTSVLPMRFLCRPEITLIEI
ncbi:MAG: metallophosphoesterase [Desulfuromonadales bacterium]|jgi:predicted MPP superfamily phosphohydrolase|nr:metallophosphoesterase [Desulfuromonadales bacterium]